MLDPESNLANQLVEAMKHHQRNAEATKEARKKLEMMEQLAEQIEQMQDEESGKQRTG